MSDSNRCQVYGLEEVDWGDTPASPLVALRFTSESLKYNINKTPSDEIRSDGQIDDATPLSASPGGGINGNLSYGEIDVYMKSALFSAGWSTPIAGAGTINCDATQNALVSATETMNTNVHAGQWILIGACSETANNDYALVTAATTTHLVLAGGLTLTTAAAEAMTFESAGMIRNGTTETSFTLERYHADQTQYFSYTGMVVNQFTLNVNSAERIKWVLDFLGKDETLAQATVGTGDATAAGTNDEINAATNIANILVGSTLADIASGVYVKSLTLTAGKNVREKDAIGYLNNVDLGSGTFNATVAASIYFYDETYYDKYVANTTTGISFRMLDSSNNGYIVTIHKAKILSDSGPNVSGQNSDCMEDITYQAVRHTTYDCMLQIDRFAA